MEGKWVVTPEFYKLVQDAGFNMDDYVIGESGGENHSTARRTGAHRASGETDSVGGPIGVEFANNRRQRTETGAAALTS